MIVKLDVWHKRLLSNFGFGPGEYPAADYVDNFLFPSMRRDFTFRIFDEDGELYAEFPDTIEPASEGKNLDLSPGEDYVQSLVGKVVAIYV